MPASRLALAGLLLVVALPAEATGLDAMTAPELDQAACRLVEIRGNILDLARKAGANPALTQAQRDFLLADYTDQLQKATNLADLIRQRQRAFAGHDFKCRP